MRAFYVHPGRETNEFSFAQTEKGENSVEKEKAGKLLDDNAKELTITRPSAFIYCQWLNFFHVIALVRGQSFIDIKRILQTYPKSRSAEES